MRKQGQSSELSNSAKMSLAQLGNLPSLEKALFLSLPPETQGQLCEMPLAEARLWFLLMIEAARSRYAMPELEMLLMVESLKIFPLEIVQRAFAHIKCNPPEGYKGMPNEGEVIAVIRELKSQDAAEFQRQEQEAYLKEMQALKVRRDAGEKFYGVYDVLKYFREKYGHELDSHFAMEPSTAKPETDKEQAARLQARRTQMFEDLYRVHPELRDTGISEEKNP